jgi:hypothetical protein
MAIFHRLQPRLARRIDDSGKWGTPRCLGLPVQATLEMDCLKNRQSKRRKINALDDLIAYEAKAF